MKKLVLFAMLLLTATMQAQTPDSAMADTYSLTISYLFASDLSQALEDVSYELEAGVSYSYDSPEIQGYTPDKVTVQGRMPYNDVMDTVRYSPNTHTVSVSPLIVHGTLDVSPSGEVEVGTMVTITAIPDDDYMLDVLMAYNKNDFTQTVTIEDFVFIMPDFDVMVSATFVPRQGEPTIDGDIETPQAICAGGTLELTAPHVTNAVEVGWQMSSSNHFDPFEVYEGQALDASYDGWKLRYMASNAMGTVYSNVVTITVKDMDGFSISGDLSSCTNLECTYRVANAGNATLTWQVTDDKAIIEPSGNTLKVLWGSKGNQQVVATMEDLESGCVVELRLDVTVQSYINDSDLHSIVAKKHEGKAYLLIYPNPMDTYKYQWYKDGVAIAGATGQYYYPSEGLANGNYQVYISFNADNNGHLFCGAFSEVYTVGGRADFAVFPNPAHRGESLSVVSNGAEAELSIYSVEGRLVHRQMLKGAQEQVDVALPQGIYMVRLSDGETVKTERIVIQ